MWAAIASTAANGYTNTFWGYVAANQEAAGVDYQAKVAENRAQTSRMQAAAAREQGESLLTRISLQGVDALARGRGGYAAGNVTLGFGSAATFEVDTAQLVARDQATQEYNTALQVWSFENDEIQANYESTWLSKMAQVQRRNARLNAAFGAITTASASISSGAQAYQGQRQPTFDQNSISNAGYYGGKEGNAFGSGNATNSGDIGTSDYGDYGGGNSMGGGD